MPQIPKSRRQNGAWFTGTNNNTAQPGNATVYMCTVVIPFKHRLLEAWYGRNKVIETGTVTVRLQWAATGTDRASATDVGTIANETASSNHTSNVIPLTDAERSTERAANSVYFLEVIGTNSADRVENPHLNILVQTSPRAAL